MSGHDKRGGSKSKELFGAIPLRAFSDSRLSGAHFRVMGAIAYHDRLGRNGQGCWVAQDKLAAEAAVHYNTLSKIARDLERYGYIIKSRHPKNRRTRVYSLIYNDKLATLSEAVNCPPETDPKNTEVNQLANYDPSIVNVENSQVPENIEEGSSQYIPLRGREDIPLRGEEKNSAKRSLAKGEFETETAPISSDIELAETSDNRQHDLVDALDASGMGIVNAWALLLELEEAGVLDELLANFTDGAFAAQAAAAAVLEMAGGIGRENERNGGLTREEAERRALLETGE